MIIKKVKFTRKYKNKQLNNNQNKNSKFIILKLESWRKTGIIESSINNQQFVCKEKKKKTRTWSKN